MNKRNLIKDKINELYKQFAEIDNEPKNIFMHIYDTDTVQGVFNFQSNKEYLCRVIDGKQIWFNWGVANEETIYSGKSSYEYVYAYALTYKGKLVALGEEQHYSGGITHLLAKEENPRKYVEELGKSNLSQDVQLYEKIKDMEIVDISELPTCPKTIYHLSDNYNNNYYLNDNTDGTYTLWFVNSDKHYGEEIITSVDLGKIRDELFNGILNNITASILNDGTK